MCGMHTVMTVRHAFMMYSITHKILPLIPALCSMLMPTYMYYAQDRALCIIMNRIIKNFGQGVSALIRTFIQ